MPDAEATEASTAEDDDRSRLGKAVEFILDLFELVVDLF